MSIVCSDSVQNEARIATEEVVEQSLDAEANWEFQLMATGSFSETLSEPHDCLGGKELERPSAASGNSNYEDNDDRVESVVLERSDANEPVPSGTETINYDAADQHMERTTCFDFCRCFPLLSIVIGNYYLHFQLFSSFLVLWVYDSMEVIKFTFLCSGV